MRTWRFCTRAAWQRTHIADYARRSREGVWTATFPTTLPDDAYFDTWITNNALTLLDRVPDDRPWYLEVNLQNPHHPWDITESMHRWYREPSVEFPLPVFNTEDIAPETHQEVRRNWAATVEHLDACLGRLVTRVRARAGRSRQHDHCVYQRPRRDARRLRPVAEVVAPAGLGGSSAGDRWAGCGGFRTRRRADDDAGSDRQFSRVGWPDPGDDLDSRSLVDYLGVHARRHRDLVFSGLSAWRMVFDGRFKLVRGYDPAKRMGGDVFEPMHVPSDETERLQRERPQLLFDLQRNERDDVAVEFPQVFQRLSAALDEHLAH